ncbi:hypothetical protein RV10_GL000653 [Enterococcus pallens]|nr:hypothetical protein RV10_GL000653 [Enterococcus pallens]
MMDVDWIEAIRAAGEKVIAQVVRTKMTEFRSTKNKTTSCGQNNRL